MFDHSKPILSFNDIERRLMIGYSLSGYVCIRDDPSSLDPPEALTLQTHKIYIAHTPSDA
jgi:hypothetical protein